MSPAGHAAARDPAALKPSWIVLGATLFAIAACSVLVWDNLLGVAVLIAAAAGLAGALLLVQSPLLACYVAVLLSLWPYGLRPPALDLVYTVAVNGAVAVAFAATILQGMGERKALFFPASLVVLTLYLGWAMVTLNWAPDLAAARRTLVAYATGAILLFVMANQIRTERALDGLMTILGILGWAMLGCGVFTLAQSGFQIGARLKVFDMNENEYGLMLLVMIPGVMWPALRRAGSARGGPLAASIVFLLTALILIALTGSRGSSLSLLLVLLAFCFSRPLRPWGALGLAICMTLLVAAPFLLGAVISRFQEGDGGALGGRDLIWTAALRLLQDQPWTGVGIGNGPGKLHNYVATLTNEFNHRSDLPAHNPFLEIGIETGFLGVLLYALACVTAVVQYIIHSSTSKLQEHLPGYSALLLGIGVGYSMAWIKGGGGEHNPTFFMMLALLIIPCRLVHGQRSPTPDNMLAPASSRGGA